MHKKVKMEIKFYSKINNYFFFIIIYKFKREKNIILDFTILFLLF